MFLEQRKTARINKQQPQTRTNEPNRNVHKITLEAPKIKIDTKRQDDAIDDHFKEISYNFLGQIQTFELGYKLDFSKDREIKQNSRSVLDGITAKI